MGDIFSALCRRSDTLWTEGKTLGSRKIPNLTIEVYHSLKEQRMTTEATIQALFEKNAKDCKLDFGHLYLPPLENDKEFVPILSMECNLKTKTPISLRVEMHGYGEGKTCAGFGFRFESPNKESNHNYYHMQVITQPGFPQWLPLQDPCIPTKTKSPISLVLFMLICFYGYRGRMLIDPMGLGKEYTAPVYDIFS